MANSVPQPANPQPVSQLDGHQLDGNQLDGNQSNGNPVPITVEKTKGFSVFRRLEWILDPVTYLERSKTYAPDFFEEDSLGFDTGPVIVTSHPEAMQYILSRDRKTFTSPGEFNRILAPLIGTDSVITISGDRHKERRQLVAPAFHGERLDVYGQLICEITQAVFAPLKPGEAFSSREFTQQISLQIISKVVFGLTDDSPRSQAIMAALTETLDSFGSPAAALLLFFNALQKDWGAWSPWGRIVRRREQLDQLIYDEIRDRKANVDPSRTDILSMLMVARSETGEGLSEKELRDELMTMLMAGHETTATAIAWAMYWIHKQPEVKAQLLADLDGLGAEATPMQIAQLPYLEAVCQETLRRSPVAMFTFPRVAEETVTFMDRTFAPGTTFLGCIFLTHQREDLYPDPKAFRPERFLERKFSPYEFIPFGNGARRCVGAALALYELKLAVATLLTHYKFRLASDRPELAKRRGVTLAPAHGVPMIFEGSR